MSFETPLPPYNASDPDASFLNSSCFDLLLIEMVPLAHRLAGELSAAPKMGSKPFDEKEQREAAFQKLDTWGYRVGQGLVERFGGSKSMRRGNPKLISPVLSHRFSRDRPRFTDTLDMIKFLCKDMWILVFRKQIDNLKTNHRVYPK